MFDGFNLKLRKVLMDVVNTIIHISTILNRHKSELIRVILERKNNLEGFHESNHFGGIR